MRKFKVLALVFTLMLVIGVLAGCGGGSEEQSSDNSSGGEKQFISIATGGVGGTYFPLGGAMAEIFNANIENVSATAETTGASKANISLLADKKVELAFVQNDISYYASQGLNMFDSKVDNIAGIATLYPEVIQIVTLADSGINSVEDLRGRKVAVGAAGSGVEANARQVLEAYGMTFEDIEPDFLSFSEAANNMKDGHIDAAFLTAGLPTAAINDLAATHDIKIIPVSDEAKAKLMEKYPYYAECVIPAGTYPNQDNDVQTVAVKAMLVVRSDLSEDLVYNLTKAIFENLDDLAAAHQRGNDISLDTAMEGMSLELHPGARKYYEEQGVL